MRLSPRSVPRWADTLAVEGLSASTVQSIGNAVRSRYAWALPRGMATVDPIAGLRLPTSEQVRDRIAMPAEARTLVAALESRDRMTAAGYSGPGPM